MFHIKDSGYIVLFCGRGYISGNNGIKGIDIMNEFIESAGTNEKNQIKCEHVRISLIESRIIRFEWSSDNTFEDRPTQNVCCRNLGETQFTVSRQEDCIIIDTEHLQIDFCDDGMPFSRKNLKVRLKGKPQTQWTPGDAAVGNLGGACQQLDMLDGEDRLDLNEWLKGNRVVDQKLLLDDGILSRDGWSVFDDSRTPVIIPHPVTGQWFEKRPDSPGYCDFYFFGFGHEYKTALKYAAMLFGRQPLPSRYAFGYWYSRYWAFCDEELEELVEKFNRTHTPLDVLVLDMDWHLPGWVGFTWDKDFFPDPGSFLKKLREQNIRVCLNVHPGDISPHENAYGRIATALNFNTGGQESIPFQIESPESMSCCIRELLNPEEERGVDFWWIDWRECPENQKKTGFSCLSWLNRLLWLDQERRNSDRRPMTFGCRGSMDSGRYPVGFSADACTSWETLAKEVELTATASNALYGYWSHDIGGHMETGETSPELYLRWMQFGAFSPVMRSHSAKFSYAERLFWNFPDPVGSFLRETILERYRWLPYIYSECRRSCDTGVSLCRPLYYEAPEEADAYRNPGEYFCGDLLLAAPVTAPADCDTALAASVVWLPPEERWYDIASGTLLEKGSVRVMPRMLSETPLFLREGAIIPEEAAPTRAGDSGIVNLLRLAVYPGGQGEYVLHEDDGISHGYERGESVETRFRHYCRNGIRRIEIDPATGSCRGWKRIRPMQIVLRGVIPPRTVLVNGEAVPSTFDGTNFAIRIDLPNVDTVRQTIVEVRYDCDDGHAPAAGMAGVLRRLRRLADIQNAVAGSAAPVKDDRLAQKLAHMGRRITLNPAVWREELKQTRELLPRLQPSFEELHKVRGRRFPFSLPEAEALLMQVEKELKQH